MKMSGAFKKNLWVILVFLAAIILINLFAASSGAIEHYYSDGFYHIYSIFLRAIFGWIPFSVGDILYLLAGIWLLFKLIKYIKVILKKQLGRQVFLLGLLKLFFVLVTIYIVFNIAWGLNYNRKGIAWQLHLPEVNYDTANLLAIQKLLLEKINDTKTAIIKNKTVYPSNAELFNRAASCYRMAKDRYGFLNYKAESIKSSTYGWLGNYLGFSGYYNPFTGEAQVNTTVPKFLLPYITLHEMGHQIGYSKENEANFSGYLAAENSPDTLFKYSAYLDLFVYANREVFYLDSNLSRDAVRKLIPEVKADLAEWKQFNEEHTSFIEPAITWLYGKYLQVNQQPKGMRSYNEVVGMLISYYRKYGRI